MKAERDMRADRAGRANPTRAATVRRRRGIHAGKSCKTSRVDAGSYSAVGEWFDRVESASRMGQRAKERRVGSARIPDSKETTMSKEKIPSTAASFMCAAALLIAGAPVLAQRPADTQRPA